MIEDSVRHGDVAAVLAATSKLTEPDRRRLAPSAIELLGEVRAAWPRWASDQVWPFPGDRMNVLGAAQVFVLATVSAAQLRKSSWGLPSADLAVEVLRARSTSLDEFMDVISFDMIRGLVRSGHVQPPTSADYIREMIRVLGNRLRSLRNQPTRVYDSLRADPGLLESEVWRVFEVEGGGDSSLAAVDKFIPDEHSWSFALAQLSADGVLPRDRLLDASLAALRRDFGAFQAGWFSRFHERLQPTRAERQRRVAEYLALLSSPIATTVSFAVQALTRVGGLPDDAVDLVAPALHARAAATVRRTLKLLPRSARAALLVVGALPQAPRATQVELLAWLEGFNRLDPGVADALASAGQNVAPALRERVERLTARTIPTSREPAADAWAGEREPTALAGPVLSVDELVHLLARLLELPDDPYEIERALDGVSRLCDRTPETLRQLEPIARRAKRVLSNTRRPFAGAEPRADIAALVLAWATGEAPVMTPLAQVQGSVLRFLSQRVLEIATRAAHGAQQPLLSLPTRPGGGIEPEVLAARRAALKRLAMQPDQADAIQAALRAGELPVPKGYRFTYGMREHSYTHQGERVTYSLFGVRVEPPLRTEPTLDRVPELFLAALSSSKADYAGHDTNVHSVGVRWVGTVWPSNREPYYAEGASELGRNVDWWEARWNVRQFLEPLLLPSEPIGQMACLLLALGLAAKEPGERTLARDVLVQAISDTRLNAPALGSTLARLYEEKVVKASRLAASFSDAARASRRHAEAVATVLEHLLAEMHGPARSDVAALLEVLTDLLVQLERDLVIQPAREYLATIRGSGKAATLARQLLAHAVSGSTAPGSTA